MGSKTGDFIWYELLTSDLAGAEAFYGAMLGWTFADSGMPDRRYHIILMGDAPIGGIMEIDADMAAQGARPAWLGYIAVDDVDALIADTTQAGGRLLMPAFDMEGVGRIALLTDPQGAAYYAMAPTGTGDSVAFASDRPRVGHCAWNELVTSDQAAAWTYYGGHFGWVQDGAMDLGPMGSYQFIRHGFMLGAMMKGMPEMGPPHWNYYFRVAHIGHAEALMNDMGATILHGPQEIPGDNFTINGIDPQGAHFAVVGIAG